MTSEMRRGLAALVLILASWPLLIVGFVVPGEAGLDFLALAVTLAVPGTLLAYGNLKRQRLREAGTPTEHRTSKRR